MAGEAQAQAVSPENWKLASGLSATYKRSTPSDEGSAMDKYTLLLCYEKSNRADAQQWISAALAGMAKGSLQTANQRDGVALAKL